MKMGICSEKLYLDMLSRDSISNKRLTLIKYLSVVRCVAGWEIERVVVQLPENWIQELQKGVLMLTFYGFG